MEYAVEMNRLIQLQMEGSVGDAATRILWHNQEKQA